MQESPKYLAWKNPKTELIKCVFVVLFLLATTGITMYFFYTSFASRYFDFPTLIWAIIFASITICFVNRLFKSPDVRIYNDRIELINFFNQIIKVIQFGEIVSWREDARSKNLHRIVIQTVGGNQYLVSSSSSNYKYLKIELLERISPMQNNFSKTYDFFVIRLWSIPLFIFLFSFLIAFIVSVNTNQVNKKEPLVKMSKRLASNINLIKSRRHHSATVKFKLQDCLEFDFVTSYPYNDIRYIALAKPFKRGDSIFITVMKKDLDKKINTSELLDFNDKHFNYSEINVYGIASSSKVYRESGNYVLISDDILIVYTRLFSFIGIIVLIIVLFQYIRFIFFIKD